VVAIGEVVLVVFEDVTAALDELGVRASPVLVGDVARKVGAEPDRVDPRSVLIGVGVRVTSYPCPYRSAGDEALLCWL
jgi:hypothetical protein